ncbi:hypothetical protein [Actinopolymorpha pittospori]|uniref:Uncharacterized protein n=1 Tax=Actinopolymorpha pittospori TaxID=648752 RepID=A0A927R9F0_9ACTN|nr:hypothetical protein [Actinopolymorpha pittospori]MBE1603915.1 hypothetical protein [Actinopolymorpha pittospori]
MAVIDFPLSATCGRPYYPREVQALPGGRFRRALEHAGHAVAPTDAPARELLGVPHALLPGLERRRNV